MRKIFLLFSAFIASASLLASNSKLPTKVEWNITDSSSHWNDGEKHRIINLDDHVKVFAQNGTNNGNCIGTPATSWATYHTYSNGILTLSALDGYWIEDFKATYTEVTDAILGDTAGDYKTKIYKSEDIIKVSNTNRMWYTASTSTGNGRLQFTNFTVNYYRIPTSITLTSATLAKGGTTTLTPTITPATASDSLTWTSSDETVATVDNNGKVTANATGYANITATGVDGIVKGECAVTVLTDKKNIIENFNNQDLATTATSIQGVIANWTTTKVQHGDNTKLKNGFYALQLSANNASITSTNLEGGIKSVSFLWNKATRGDNTVAFCVSAGSVADSRSQAVVTGDTWNFDPDSTYFHEFGVKSNAQLSITNNNSCNMGFGYITIVPYLYYTEKTHTMNIGDTYVNTSLIDNRDNATPIVYSIVSGSDKVSLNGDRVTAIAAGNATIQATWGDVSTIYGLEVVEDIVIDENAIEASWTPNDTRSVQLIRTLSTDGYNTLCLPFDVAANELSALGEGVQLYTLSSVDQSSGVTLNFTSASSIVAGTPYLVEVTSANANPTFTSRTMGSTTPGSTTQGNATFHGVYAQTLLDPDATPTQYFLSGNLLYRPVAADYMKGIRGYFTISNVSANTPIRMAINKPDIPTNLETPSLLGEGRGETHKMLINGQLVIIRDGKTFSIIGQRFN